MRYLRDESNPFDVPEREFIKNYRLPQYLILDLIEELKPMSSRHSSISFHIRVLIAINFFATGSYQTAVGKQNLHNVSQPTVSRCINEVSRIMDGYLAQKYIRFPITIFEKNEKAAVFQNRFNLPNAIGCIDCVHIAIISPPTVDPIRPARLYRNRKIYYSINVEATCDADMIFTSVNARFPGSTHDSGIWLVSPVRRLMRQNRSDHFLIGDSGYPLEPVLFNPIADPATRQEHKFNKLHKAARNTIERSFGVLKSVYRCMLKHRTLHYYPVTAGKIINSCFALHNYSRLRGFYPESHLDDNDLIVLEPEPDETQENILQTNYHDEGLRRRQEYCASL